MSILLVGTTTLQASHGKLLVTWDPNTETDLAGYRIYIGTTSGDHSSTPIVVPRAATSYLIRELDPTLTYYVALTAFDTSGNESDFSNEASGQPRTPGCGDGELDLLEECDDGNVASGDGCSATCKLEVCGNGTLDPGEQCDDGNPVSGDGCSALCRLEACGNDVVDLGEECDDGNTVAGDGCTPSCLIERISQPTVSSVTRSIGDIPYLPECTFLPISVNGLGFQVGVSVSAPNSGLTVFSSAAYTPTSLRRLVWVPSGTVPGRKDFHVTNPDGGTGTASATDPSLSNSLEVIRTPTMSESRDVGVQQLNLLAIAFGTCSSEVLRNDGDDTNDDACPAAAEVGYNPVADMNGDGFIDGIDLTVLGTFLGTSVTYCS